MDKAKLKEVGLNHWDQMLRVGRLKLLEMGLNNVIKLFSVED